MATETRIRITRNPYSGFEVWIWGNGELTRRSFHNGHELTTVLTGECVSDEALEAACDQFEALEWQEAYPLGVVYVGEAVCDCPVDGEPFVRDDECDCYLCRPTHIDMIDLRCLKMVVGGLAIAVGYLLLTR